MKALNYLLLIAGVAIFNLESYVMVIEKMSKMTTVNPDILEKLQPYFESSGPVMFLAVIIIILALKSISNAKKNTSN